METTEAREPETGGQATPKEPFLKGLVARLRSILSRNSTRYFLGTVLFGLVVLLGREIYLELRGGYYGGTPLTQSSKLPTSTSEPTPISEAAVDTERLSVTVVPTSFSKLVLPAFAQADSSETKVVPAVPAYSLSSADLLNLKDIEDAAKVKLSDGALSLLEDRGFFTQPAELKVRSPDDEVDPDSRVDDMADLYREIGGSPHDMYREPENAVFITSDFLLHIYHRFIDKTFEYIEETKWHPILKKLSEGLLENSLSRYQSVVDPQDKESLKRVSAFFLVPTVILESSVAKLDEFSKADEENAYQENDKVADDYDHLMVTLASYEDRVPVEIYDLAKSELELISKAEGLASSPIFGPFKPETMEDYTQYTPRSHYTKNSVLRTYFRAMIWYGRGGFDVKSLDLTRDAANVVWALNSVEVNGQRAIDLWEAIYLPTVFFVGRSDDLTIYDYSALMKEIYGEGVKSEDLGSKITDFQLEAAKLEGPKILSEAKLYPTMAEVPTKEELLAGTKGFRFMGQRFIPDSYMFTKLTQGDEPADPETGQKLPSTPTALMIMSILGSEPADQFLNDWIADNAPNSDKVIAKVKNALTVEFKKVTEDEWTQNIYWSWLYTIKSLLGKFGDGYPMFMKGDPWTVKGLQTALGSWTELRHDTLLYAKQSYAEKGGGGEGQEIPPVPKGYVEPNIALFDRLLLLTKMTKDGLKSRGLLPEVQEPRLDKFIKGLEFLRSIAVKELSGESISDDDYERLRVVTRIELEGVVYPINTRDIFTERDARAALIADVHTDVPNGQVLYEATGIPSVIYVAVKDSGGTRLTRGVVYSYYEFTAPLAKRLSDEDWQGKVYDGSGTLPESPAWTQSLSSE